MMKVVLDLRVREYDLWDATLNTELTDMTPMLGQYRAEADEAMGELHRLEGNGGNIALDIIIPLSDGIYLDLDF